MASPSIIVRSLVSDTEREQLFQWSDQEFSPSPSLNSARRFQQFVTTQPEYRPEIMRGIFLDGKQVGGCIIFERTLRMGTARLVTGCIGDVVTHPEHRKQGIATALMQDAINYALSHKYSLLLLDGIPKFYHRYGYCDVFDLSIHDIDRSAVLAQPSSPYTVRPATIDDAPSLLALYDQHYGPYTGSFVRSLERQIHLLQHRSPHNPILLAVDSADCPQGYLFFWRGADRSQAHELAVNDWPAVLALLQYHAQLLDSTDAPAFLRYRLPVTAPVLQWLVDYLEVPDTSPWREEPVTGWAVLSHTYHHRYTGWMARPAHLPTLIQAVLPEWQARWQRSLLCWSGTINLTVGKEVYALRINSNELQLLDQPGEDTHTVQLSPQAFTQSLFGYRPVSRLVQSGEQPITNDLLTVLNVLFPTGHTWIPASDWF
ncbi:MAG: GNAT family N-acetyltransferase [Chloroflexi bacterium]|nr:GNAT family N-acetyltransferase [Chloroflexota bacterium]